MTMQLFAHHTSKLMRVPRVSRCVNLFAGLCLSLLTIALAGCSPRYDWREVRPEGAAWVASFPDRTQTQTRTMTLEGQALSMTMTGAQVDDVSFTIGQIDLPEQASPTASEAALKISELLRRAMLRNIQGTVLHEQSVQLPREEKNLAAVTANALEAKGSMGNHSLLLASRFTAYETGSHWKVLQIIVLGPQADLSRPAGQQAIETFMTSIRLQ